MDTICLLGIQGEEMFGDDYQFVFPDGTPGGQVLVLSCRDPGEHIVSGATFCSRLRPQNGSFTFRCNIVVSNIAWWAVLNFKAAPKVAEKPQRNEVHSPVQKLYFVFYLWWFVFALCQIYLKETVGKLCCHS